MHSLQEHMVQMRADVWETHIPVTSRLGPLPAHGGRQRPGRQQHTSTHPCTHTSLHTPYDHIDNERLIVTGNLRIPSTPSSLIHSLLFP
mmetsp:Transcript_20008/g.53946  ORF Transcript_20008/g.53946 Transcript_20008/m.53946 type:complete len:89 (-) Transcript_20008:293-559(-)